MNFRTQDTSKPSFTAHNIRLDDQSCTIDETKPTIDQHPWFLGVTRVLQAYQGAPNPDISIVDLGCLEGGYTVELARLGFDVSGIEVRDSNFAACRFVKDRTDLPNLKFIQDDVRNLAQHGEFDVIFCSGLLYHLDKPVEFLKVAANQTKHMIILQTHFAPDRDVDAGRDESGFFTRVLQEVWRPRRNYKLGRIVENEGARGRWFGEPGSGDDNSRWSSWGNKKSFWLTRAALLQTLKDVGFDLVFEQFDNLSPSISESMIGGYYASNYRSTFVGIKTGD